MGKISEDHAILQRRYNSMCTASEADALTIKELMGRVLILERDIGKLDKELEAAQSNTQLLGNAINEKNQEAGVEIQRLRDIIKGAGLDPN